MIRSHRFAILAQRDINKETFVEPWPEAGLMVTDSPYDPRPSLQLEKGQVVEMDSRQRADFDAIDLFIAGHGLDLTVAAEAMATPSRQIQRASNRSAAIGRRLHRRQIDRDYQPHERARNDDGSGQNARATYPGQPGPRYQLARAPGPTGRRRRRSGSAWLCRS